MANKSIKRDGAAPKKISEPALFAANKVKELRRKRNISPKDISLNTEIQYGAIERLEFPRVTDKYSLGKLNMIGKYFNQKVEDHNTKVVEAQGGFKLEVPPASLHDFLPTNPLLAKYKIPKIIEEFEKDITPREAIMHLIEKGLFKNSGLSTDIVQAECEKMFEKQFIYKSIRNSLDHFVKEEPVLEKHKNGKVVFYKEK